MITSDVVRIINELEKRFPVDEWRIQGIRVWPLYRIGLYFGFIRSGQSGAASFGRWDALRLRMSQAFSLFTGFIRYCRAIITDRTKNARLSSPVDAVFLSEGISFANINGAWYAKFCDPLIRRLAVLGRSSLLIDLSHNYLVPRHTASIYRQFQIDLIKIRTRFLSSRRDSVTEELPGHDALIRYAEQEGFTSFLPSRSLLRWQAYQVRSIADLFGRIFRKVRPKIGFNVSYYRTEGMAFNLACHEAGIPSVDIQHGIAGELCPPYGRWGRVPVDGYALLPSVFWSWSEPDAAAINAWSPGGSKGHRAVVGGNPWMLEWQQDDSLLVQQHDRMYAEAFAGSVALKERMILVTLQTGFSTVRHLAPLLRAMQTAPASWRWLVRVHPCMLNEKDRIIALLNEYAIRNVEVERSTDLPLFTLLRHVDVHVTHSSATVIEAAAFNVPSVVTSTYGAEFFSRQIAEGWARPALTDADIVRSIEDLVVYRNDQTQHQATRTDTVSGALEILNDLMDQQGVQR